MPQKPMRLPPVSVLRVKQPNKKPENPCIAVMTSVLGESTSPICPAIAFLVRCWGLRTALR